MMPQSDFMVVAPIASGHEDALRQLLASMNLRPGVVDVNNGILPFAKFNNIHFARLMILDDQTIGDISAYGLPPGNYPLQFAFLADVDGEAEDFLRELIAKCGPGLRRLFSHCEGFAETSDLFSWMRAREHPPSTRYVNFVGRSVVQTQDEAALHTAISQYVTHSQEALAQLTPEAARREVKNFISGEISAGRLRLSQLPSAPLGWRLRKLANLIYVPIVLLLLLPFLLLYSPIFVYQLRKREKSDPVIAPTVESSHAIRLAELEDHAVTNQFTAMGTLKPGRFRLWTLKFFLWVINYTTRHIYNHGRLARVSTIHFARWVFIDGRRRLVFCSNYDGSLEAYMDDFINKVAFGLNLVFGHGVGYPRTDWMILRGAKDEQTFKHVLRRHQVPTEVWYNAHEGWTAVELLRNSMIREGFEKTSMTEDEARSWFALI